MVPRLSKEEVEFQAKTTKKYSLTEGNDTMNGLTVIAISHGFSSRFLGSLLVSTSTSVLVQSFRLNTSGDLLPNWRGKEGGNVWCTAASRNLPSNLQAKFLIYLRKVPPSDGRRLKSDRWTSFIEWGGPWKRLIRGRLVHLCRQKVWRVA